MFRFVTQDGESRVDLLAIFSKVVDTACKQAFAKSEKGCTKLPVKTYIRKVGSDGICHGTRTALFKEGAPDAKDSGVALSVCEEAADNGGKTTDLTEIRFFRAVRVARCPC